MRLKGTLVDWKDDRGFGFIEPAGGGSQVFVHISAFEVRARRPMAGDQLTYELTTGKDGRASAARVRPVGLEEARYQERTARRPNEAPVSRRASRVWNRATLILIATIVAGYAVYESRLNVSPTSIGIQVGQSSDQESVRTEDEVLRAFREKRSNVQVRGFAVVQNILSDDNNGSRHQRMIVRTASGQTVLIAHNIDLAPRVSPLSNGDRIEFFGEYEWNEKGGVVHWTHHDPDGRHVAGWIKANGETVQ